jgi:hypothetical protein
MENSSIENWLDKHLFVFNKANKKKKLGKMWMVWWYHEMAAEEQDLGLLE